MAYVNCPEHGGNEAAAVCDHVAARVRSGDPIDGPLAPVSASFEGKTIGPTWLCAECALKFEVPSEGLTLTGEAGLNRYWMVIGFALVCAKCFEEAL